MPNLTKADADEIYVAGQHMSNWLYNQSQKFNFAVYKNEMQNMAKDWDRVKGTLYRADRKEAK
jgi:hypothetical protein